ncbi:MAG: histidine triad nucleotide-binding protein [Candidatus Andersenbacteria bacterium]|nr:histidine triad nucleotide-binding protein [bacterium]MDZ4225380.1 histidine triad nucleotide-binding protein [Candidatus Andersenbacteria bacterium]
MTARRNETHDPDCIFCRMVTGETPVEAVYESTDTLFFRDISPKAKVHVLGIPKRHIVSLAHMTDDDQLLIGKLIHDATKVARDLGLVAGGYRIISNVGDDAGQVVKHVHFHVLGGERLGPMRC